MQCFYSEENTLLWLDGDVEDKEVEKTTTAKIKKSYIAVDIT
jgi:hypothetical protein